GCRGGWVLGAGGCHWGTGSGGRLGCGLRRRWGRCTRRSGCRGVGVWGCTAVGAPCPAGVPLAGESSRVGGCGGPCPAGAPLAGRSLGLGGCGGPCPAGAPLAGRALGLGGGGGAVPRRCAAGWQVLGCRVRCVGPRRVGRTAAWATLRQRRAGGTSPVRVRLPRLAAASGCGCLCLPACVGLWPRLVA